MLANSLANALIFPLSFDEFKDSYFERLPFLSSRKNADHFRDIIRIEDFYVYLDRNDIRYPALRMVKDGIEQPQGAYLKNIPFGNQVFEGLVDKDRMWTTYNAGATIVFQALHRSIGPLGELCSAIEQLFGCPVQCNAYLTPPSSKGFLPHYDGHDVFVLQIHGKKHWMVYDSPSRLPLIPFDKQTWEKGEPQLDVTMQAGETLYIPRGFVHEGITTEHHSLHLTIGLLSNTWLDVFNRICSQGAILEEFRESIDLRDISDEIIISKFVKFTENLITQIDLKKVRSEFDLKSSGNGMSIRSGRLENILLSQHISVSTMLQARLSFSLQQDGDRCIILFGGKRVIFPKAIFSLLKKLPGSAVFKLGELEEEDGQNSITVVRKLVKEGLLSVVQL